ncbi:alpha/beta fold hydrolase [Marinobacter adhaerens]|uniref:alpha/beta fold hydrolase n=1 Tax=Marinobacter adhaerens TaxID=1033846 RepID=UPI001C58EB89|nr:alpha/beta hydrolase [Marinobacter adhaerens]MBW3227261.1 alpha/beta hydrolase [Marinobacter adhaerens]
MKGIWGSALALTISLFLTACSQPIDQFWLEQKYGSPASRFMPIDGNRVHYRDEGVGEPLVLIHGTASSLHTWDKWAQELKSNYRVIRLDLPGFGLTGPDRADRYEIEDDVRLLTAFLARLGVEKVHLAGSSLGGRIAWQLALDYPEKVTSLTLLNALGYPQERWPLPIEMAQWPIMDDVMASFSPRFMYASGLKDVYFNDSLVNERLVDRYFELSRYPGNLAAFPKRVQARLDTNSLLIPGIRVPTLILWGEEDNYFPVGNAHRFGADITNSRVHVYPDVGHLPMEEVPELSLAHFTAFIRENAAQ